MKHFYTLCIALFLFTAVNAQKEITTQTFNGLTALPYGFSQIGADGNITFTDSTVNIKYPGTITGIASTFSGVSDSINFNIDFISPDKWTYFLLFNIKNSAGDTIAQIQPQCSQTGRIVICKRKFSGLETAAVMTAADTVLVGGISKKTPIKLGIKINVKTKKINATIDNAPYDESKATDLLGNPDGTIVVELLAVNIAGSGNFWVNNLEATGTGVLGSGGTVGVRNAIASDAICTMPTRFSVSKSGASLMPTIKGEIKNYSYKIFDLSGKQVFATTNQQTGWNGYTNNRAIKGLYFMAVSGVTSNGEKVNRTGKVLVVE